MNSCFPKLSLTFFSNPSKISPPEDNPEHTTQSVRVARVAEAKAKPAALQVAAAKSRPTPDSEMRRSRWNKPGRTRSQAPRSERSRKEVLRAQQIPQRPPA